MPIHRKQWTNKSSKSFKSSKSSIKIGGNREKRIKKIRRELNKLAEQPKTVANLKRRIALLKKIEKLEKQSIEVDFGHASVTPFDYRKPVQQPMDTKVSEDIDFTDKGRAYRGYRTSRVGAHGSVEIPQWGPGLESERDMDIPEDELGRTHEYMPEAVRRKSSGPFKAIVIPGDSDRSQSHLTRQKPLQKKQSAKVRIIPGDSDRSQSHLTRQKPLQKKQSAKVRIIPGDSDRSQSHLTRQKPLQKKQLAKVRIIPGDTW